MRPDLEGQRQVDDAQRSVADTQDNVSGYETQAGNRVMTYRETEQEKG